MGNEGSITIGDCDVGIDNDSEYIIYENADVQINNCETGYFGGRESQLTIHENGMFSITASMPFEIGEDGYLECLGVLDIILNP